MRRNRLDLNLLITLDTLLSERSITRSAERLNLTPSAVSSALSRLREYFHDDLLVQVGRRMEPTPRAEGLHDAVRDVLVRIDSTLTAQPEFDPRVTDRSFRIFLSDYSQMVLIPHVLALASQQKSRARLELLPQVINPQRSLERGDADLLIIPRLFTSPDHPQEVLYEESFDCVVWEGSALAKGEFTLERYLAADHVVTVPEGRLGDTFESGFLRKQGVARRVTATTYSFGTLPALIQGTEMVATVHSRLARWYIPRWPLVTRKPPVPMEPMEQAVQWHKYRSQDPGLAWLRELLQRAVQRMDAAAPAALESARQPSTAAPLPAGPA